MPASTDSMAFASQVRALLPDLTAAFPEVDPAAVAAAVGRAAAQFATARVPDFRVVLVEKRARSELREVQVRRMCGRVR